MSNQSIQITYKEIAVTYDETRNRWIYTLRDREKSSESLALAKAEIDKPAPKTAKPFEKIKAWWTPYGGNPSPVTITGISEPDFRGRLSVWIRTEDGSRKKESAERCFYPSSEGNDAIIASILERRRIIEKADNEIHALKLKLKPLVIEPEA